MTNGERRSVSAELRVATREDGTRTISGFIPYNSDSVELSLSDGRKFKERIAPGAMRGALQPGSDVLSLRDHDPKLILGRTKSRTLTFEDGPDGMGYTVALPKTTAANDLAESVDRGDVDATSFGFDVPKGGDSWEKVEGGLLRTIKELNLYEVSPCSFAAYPNSSLSIRSLPMELVSTERGHTEKRHRSVVSAVSGVKWAITQDKLQTICSILAARESGATMSEAEIRAAMMGVQSSEPQTSGTVAVIPIYGTISNRANMFSEFSGGTSIQKLTAAFRSALADHEVQAIVFDVDSPGGTVDGVPELAAEIFAAREQKPIIAVANTMAASAGYYLACAAGTLVVAPSGEVGSIGVYMMHEDWSQALEKEGVDITFISAGDFKTEGNPYEPLSAAAKAYDQKGINALYGKFVSFVAQARGVSVEKVLETYGQGRMLLADDALAAGMVDKIATLDETLAGFGVTDPRTSGSSDSANAATVEATAECDCDCPACQDDNCAECSDEDCDDPNCDCADPDGDEPGEAYDSAACRHYMDMTLELRKRNRL